MADTATTRNRFRKLESGQYANAWATPKNEDYGSDRLDEALDGVSAFTLSGSKTLTSTNYETDEARMRFIHITGGTGGTITIPSVEKWYWVRNASSGNVIFTAGGTTVTIPTATVAAVLCNGTNCFLTTTASDLTASAASAAAAATSATNAATSETNAAASASSASTSATTATTKASEASTSATNAATSATTATTKASEASTSATNAATSATNAATSETNAAASATTATTKASEASTSASSASTSATTATTKASEASTSATNAATSETNAATSATNAANSATAAQTAQTAAEAAALPNQSGHSGKIVTTSGSAASWAKITDITADRPFVGATPAAGASGYASFRLPHGAAPTTNLTNGDLWTTTSGLYARVNGATVGPLIDASSAPSSAWTQIGTTQTPSAVSSSSITSIPATYQDLLIEVLGLSTSDAASINFDMSDDGTNWTGTTLIATSAAGADTYYGAIFIPGYLKAGGQINKINGSLSSDRTLSNAIGTANVAWRIAAGIQAVRFTTTAGTFDAGSWKLWGK
jgi:chemotaxis protein histidine kinase CheA